MHEYEINIKRQYFSWLQVIIILSTKKSANLYIASYY